MSSSQKTYGRKRKDDASEKFDAIFSSQVIKKPITIEIAKIKKPKLDANVPAITARMKNGTSKALTVSTATDASSKSSKPEIKLYTISPTKLRIDADKTKNSNNHSNLQNQAPFSYNSIANSRYDLLFKKNEKNASDKFDALFSDELKTSSDTAKPSSFGKLSSSPDFDDLFGFADSSDEIKAKVKSPPQAVNNFDRTSQISLKNSDKIASGITGASMKTIGGKVVLNIHKRTMLPTKPSCVSPTKASRVFSPSNGDSHTAPSKSIQSVSLSNKVEHLSASKNSVPLFPSGVESNIDQKLKNVPISVFSKTSQATNITSSASNTAASRPIQKHNRKPGLHKRTYSPLKQQTNSVIAKPSYNSRPWMQDSEEIAHSSDKDSISSSQPDSYDFDSEQSTPKLVRAVTWPDNVGENIVTSLKCSKNAKEYFTVVKHVKNYQNCLEEGEAKEFEDEVSYLLEGMQPSQPISVRCLCITNFASKCQHHNFRLYLRAHNIADKVFSNLDDTKDNPDLALSTAALLFMLSRDRQMEINKPTLQLLLRLLDPFDKDDGRADADKSKAKQSTKATGTRYKFFKSKDKNKQSSDAASANVESINKIKQMVSDSGDHLLSEQDVSVKRLSSEALLRFTARRTVEWFREEVRLKGGLDHIISLIKTHVDKLEALAKGDQVRAGDDFKPKTTLCILERLLKVLENAIVNSPRNAMYLVTHQRALLLKKMARMMETVKSLLPRFPPHPTPDENDPNTPPSMPSIDPYTVLHNSTLQIIKLLVNISNDNEWVSSRVGEQEGMLANIVDGILFTPSLLKANHRYELTLLSLSLLVNLVESSAKNRIALMKMKTSYVTSPDEANANVVQSLITLFEQREAAARENEILGEVGVKKAVEAKKGDSSASLTRSTSSSTGSRPTLGLSSEGGHWVETEDGMEWVPSEDSDDVITSSQESCRSNVSAKNLESNLTAEEKTEMKETLDKVNEHMEDSIVASYAALVLGCLINGNRANSPIIRSHFSDKDGFKAMIRMLKKFLSFMSLTAGMSSKGEKTLTQIIETVEEEENAFRA